MSFHYLYSEQVTQYPEYDKYSAFHSVNKNQELKTKKEQSGRGSKRVKNSRCGDPEVEQNITQ